MTPESLEPRTLLSAETFSLHSLPGANHRIYLDFNGHVTSGTTWNSNFTSGADIVSVAFDLDGDVSSLSASEEKIIREIWAVVSEDFAPFAVDVTTEDPGVEALRKNSSGPLDNEWGIRVVISGSSSWYPGGDQGVAFVGSFDAASDVPVFVFSDQIPSYSPAPFLPFVQTISHEVGHSLGLTHDGSTTTQPLGPPPGQYYYGHETSTEGLYWAPIMGKPITSLSVLTQWSKGEYEGANNQQDDLAIITTENGFGYREDDHGDSATVMTPSDSQHASASGIIERNTDSDSFIFTVSQAGNFRIDVRSALSEQFASYSGVVVSNLDIRIGLLSNDEYYITTISPGDSLEVSLIDYLPAEKYFLVVDGVSKGGPSTNGYSDYGSLGSYVITISTTDGVLSPPTTSHSPTDLVLSNSNIPEGVSSGATVGTFVTIDNDLSDSFTYSLVTGTGSDDNSSFQIVGNELRTNGVFDHEAKSSYSVRVRTTDQTGGFFEKSLTISATNVNEAPTSITLSATSIAETVAIGTTVGTFSATDPDAGDSFTFSLASGTGDTGNSAFTINGNQLKTATTFDFDTQSSYSIRVRATDANGLSTETILTITVTPAVVPRSGTIQGQKFEDLNGDGVKDDGEPGLSGWTILLHGVDGFGNSVSQTTETLADDPETEPNEAGMYGFDNLASGEYVISEVQHPGWVQSYPTGQQAGGHVETNGSLQVLRTMSGSLGGSTDGLGTNGSGLIQADVPVGSTLLAAYLHVATRGVRPAHIGFEGQSVPLTYLTNVGRGSSGLNFETGRADVTSIVVDVVDSSSGILSFSVDESLTGDVDSVEGTSLTVVYSHPSLPVRTIVILEGGLTGSTPQTNVVTLSSPINKSNPNFVMNMALGIQFGFQGDQYSTIKVNGQLLTSGAGNYDDGYEANGGLITVGGIGDSLNTPSDPFATNGDDELYDLSAFLDDGDTQIRLETANPSNDDSIFLVVFTLPGVASIGSSGEYLVNLSDDDVVRNRDFGSFVPGSIHGYKFHDVDGDGVEAVGEPRQSGVVITLASDRDGDSIPELQTTVTDVNGEYAFENLLPGVYTVSETVFEGSQATRPTSFRVTVQSRQELVAYSSQARLNDGDPRVEVLASDADGDGYRDLIFGNHLTNMPVPIVAIAASDAVKSEGFSRSTSFSFTVSRSGDTSDSASVDYSVTGSGAYPAGADDFGGEFPSGMVAFAAGESSKTITIDVSGDATIESDEGFTVTLSNPTSGFMITTATALGTIRNDDVGRGAGEFSEQKIISTATNDPIDVVAADIDGDGFMDVVSSSYGEGGIVWYQSDGQEQFTRRVISSSTQSAHSVFVADVDMDGDNDVLATSASDNKVLWYENDGAENFTEHVISTSAERPHSVVAADIDGDGDVDIASASFQDDKIAWYENNGNQQFTARTVTTDADGALSVEAADIDGDGDMDLLSASLSDDQVAWYENDGHQNFARRVITIDPDGPNTGVEGFADGAYSAVVADVDGDGDWDVVAVSDVAVQAGRQSRVAWFENDGNEQFIPHTVSTNVTSPRSVVATDLDGDGDADVVVADVNGHQVAWLENDGSQNFAKHTLAQRFSATASVISPWSVFVADIDGDGVLDVVSASSGDEKVVWYKQTADSTTPGPTTTLSISPTTTQQLEGNSGQVELTFTVNRTGDTSGPTSVDYAVTGSDEHPANADDFGGALPFGTVIFAPSETSKTITITVSGDSTVEDDESFTVTLSSPSTGVSLSIATASGTITNDDVAGFSITQPTGVLLVGEDGSTAQFTVRLTAQPVSNVVLTVSSSDTTEATVGSATVTFTPSNWDVAQTVTVTGVDDVIVDGIISSTVTVHVNAPASDDAFDVLADRTVSVTTSDNDFFGFRIVESSGSTNVSESGSTDTFTVVLAAQPTSNVVLNLTSSDTGEATVAPATLTFTSSNWNRPQTVTLKGVNDDVVDGSQSSKITIRVNASLSENRFDSFPPQTVNVTTADDEVAGFRIVESSGSTSVNESGTTDTFTVVLTARPLSNVVLSLVSSDTGEATVTPATLTFTTSNWKTAQTVSVRGANDDLMDGTQSSLVTIRVNDAISDNAFDDLDDETVAVTTIDNDFFDFGDAPNSYGTSLLNGARHLATTSGPKLGSQWDSEPDGQPSVNAAADGADEDGVFFAVDLLRRASQVVASSVFVTASKAAKLDAWIDFNRDGDFDDAGERIATAKSVAAGLSVLPFNVPAAASLGDTFARFRISTSGVSGSTGSAADGEVEDYAVKILDGDVARPLTVDLPGGAPAITVATVSGNLEVKAGSTLVTRVSTNRVTSLEINGSAGNDKITLSALPSSLAGGVTLNGAAGDDSLAGTAAGVKIVLKGGSGRDTLLGGSGDDTLLGDSGDDSLKGNAGADILLGGDGKDTLFGDAGNDALVGDAGDDSLDGGADKDTLLGLGGKDTLKGGDGNDTILGGDGDDSINGGAGTDTLVGNAGSNRFDVSGERNELFTFDIDDILDRL